MAARRRSPSSAVARWHADETTVSSPLIASEVASLRRTRVFGATGTVLMAIGALG
ncbi:MAG: alpha,6-mannosyltransferase, partial [Mycobacterium sp.]|nr:alpha,6-mannosyltransferase [Mycobacterium sp.]